MKFLLYHVKACICLCFTLVSITTFTQDLEHSYIVLSNHTNLQLSSIVRVEDNLNSVDVGTSVVKPWENCNYHELNDRIITTILDIVFNIAVDHKDNPHLVKLKRSSFSGGKDYNVEVDILANNELLFTILFDFIDKPNSLQNPSNYNIKYPDNTLDAANPYSLLFETSNSPHLANRDITVDGVVYKLIYGTFNNDVDITNNIIFSLSEKEPTTFNYEPNALEVDDPSVLNVLTYNIGLLMPLNSNDQEERERIPVLHQAIPKNMDIIMWQEMFEQYWVNRLIDSLSEDYPYYTQPHNQPSIPGLTKNGGALIMSKFPILEEGDFSYQNDAGIEANGESIFADKGVKYAKIDKHGQIIHVFNSHTSGLALENDAMGAFILNTVNPNYDDVVIMGGDMNTKIFTPNYYRMEDSLKTIQPTYRSLLNNQVEMQGTTWGYNHYGGGRGDTASFIDYVFVHRDFKIPTKFYNETQAYRINITDRASWGIFDMGDHQPVYARIELPNISATISDSTLCIGDNLSINATTSLASYTVKWYKNGELLENESSLSLNRTISDVNDYGLYECYVIYTYLPDESINQSASVHPPYLPQGAIEGKLLRSFNVVPIPNVCDIVSNDETLILKENSVYPNPVTKEVNIEVINQFKNSDVIIYNAKGQQVYNATIDTILTIDVSNWMNGHYTIVVSKLDEEFTKVFIKQ